MRWTSCSNHWARFLGQHSSRLHRFRFVLCFSAPQSFWNERATHLNSSSLSVSVFLGFLFLPPTAVYFQAPFRTLEHSSDWLFATPDAPGELLGVFVLTTGLHRCPARRLATVTVGKPIPLPSAVALPSALCGRASFIDSMVAADAKKR